MTYEEASRRLNDCEYLFLERFGHGMNTRDLHVELVEARVQREIPRLPLGSAVLEDILGPGSPILPDEDCAHFTLVFENYLAISIINESYDDGDGTESTEWLADKSRKPFRSYDKSRFRDYVSSVTFATDDFPGPQRHFEVGCLNHILNVICRDDPIITITSVGEIAAARSG